MEVESKLLTILDVAHKCSISRSTIYRQMQQGKLPIIKIGRSIRFRNQDIENFLSSSAIGSKSDNAKHGDAQ